MTEKEYLTVKEFAKEVDISVQAVYQRLNKDLKKYFKEIDGKKMINVMAIEIFSFKDDVKEVEQDFNNSLTSALKDSLKMMEKQLEEKDKQIAKLMEMNTNNQILLKHSQDRVLELEIPKKEKLKEENLFKRLFKK